MSEIPSQSITPAQRKVLEAIEAGKVRRYNPWRGGKSVWNVPPGVNRGTVQRVFDLGLARFAARETGDLAASLYQPLELSDIGREALA